MGIFLFNYLKKDLRIEKEVQEDGNVLTFNTMLKSSEETLIDRKDRLKRRISACVFTTWDELSTQGV